MTFEGHPVMSLQFFYDKSPTPSEPLSLSRANVMIKRGLATWWIDGVCYGRDKSPEAVVGHFETLLGWRHAHCETLRSWLVAAGVWSPFV